MATVTIKHHTGAVLAEGATILAALIAAVKSGADLSGANLYEANLSGANLYEANLSRANLSKANLSGANLYEANLSGANLYEANLSGADLSGANLSRANLYRADLSGANLYEANLYRADLSGADLSGANLSRANLYSASRSDGYAFILQAGLRLYAGCRAWESFAAARSHYASGESVSAPLGGKLQLESMALIDHLERMARIAGWLDCHAIQGPGVQEHGARFTPPQVAP